MLYLAMCLIHVPGKVIYKRLYPATFVLFTFKIQNKQKKVLLLQIVLYYSTLGYL